MTTHHSDPIQTPRKKVNIAHFLTKIIKIRIPFCFYQRQHKQTSFHLCSCETFPIFNYGEEIPFAKVAQNLQQCFAPSVCSEEKPSYFSGGWGDKGILLRGKLYSLHMMRSFKHQEKHTPRESF